MGNWEIGVVAVLVVVVLYLFLREVLPVAVTAMLAAAVLMLVPASSWDGAILSPEEGLSGFSSQATIAVMVMFVISAGIERSGAVSYLSQWLLRWAGKSPRRQVVTLGAVAGPLSGFVNNTPVVGVLIPVAGDLARKAGHSPSRLLMPLSFFAMLGGTLTIIGTSTNLLGNALLEDAGLEPFAFFEFSLIGLAALGVAAVYFLTIGPSLVPDRGGGSVVDRFDLKNLMAEYEVPGDSDAVGKTLGDMGLVRHHGVQVIRAFRGDDIIPSPRRDFVIHHGDLFLVQGSRERLEGLPEKAGLRSLAELKHGLERVEEGDDDVLTAELVIAPGSRLEGKSLEALNFRERYDALVLAIRHRDRVAIGPLSKTRLSAGDVLLIQTHPDTLPRLEESAAFLVTRARAAETFRKDKIAISLSILAAVVAITALGLAPLVTVALGGAVAMVLTGCLKIEEFIESIRWDIILLLAGIIPMGIALEKSGAAALAADGLVAAGAWMPPLALLITVFVTTSLITEMISNNASAVLLIPIMIATAVSLGYDPRPFVLAVMLSASTSMLTPVGYQTNTMVYAPGNYRFSDYARVGGPLNLILAVVIPLLIAWRFPL